ncbi:hypothetical protein DRQ25_05140 [Candidatus Fermentibacteria bacterium]|nr:MAG: hypothetical protein DRQ25_05140 [Candidatus Fermentibacteria bacterium]
MGRKTKTIQQKIIATNDFDGTAPLVDAVKSDDIYKHAAETAGGLFDFGTVGDQEIVSIELKLAGQSAWTIHKKDAEGIELLLWVGTTETDFVTLAEDRTFLTEDQTLLLRTTGATGALTARITVDAFEG